MLAELEKMWKMRLRKLISPNHILWEAIAVDKSIIKVSFLAEGIAFRISFSVPTRSILFCVHILQRPARFLFLKNFFNFHFSFSISSRFNFTFTSQKRVKGFYSSLFTSQKKWKLSVFFSREKEWNQVRGITSPLSLFPIVFPKIVKSQVSTSLKILAKFQFQNLD